MDTYVTIAAPAEEQYTQLRSRFIALAIPVESEQEALAHVARLRQQYYDARHVCWAYRLGPTGERSRSNDDGEPSGTAGKPILGQLVSLGLTNIMVLVVRYFGGVKLGTSGLITAYREATIAALEASERLECIIERALQVSFGYELMGEVMRHVKEMGARVLVQDFRESCILELSIRADEAETLYQRLDRLYGTHTRWLE